MAAVAASWAAVGAALRAGQVPAVEPPLLPEEWTLLLAPPAVFWLCVAFWRAVVALFPNHAAQHVLKGPAIRSPSVTKARANHTHECCIALRTLLRGSRRASRAAQVVSYTLAYQVVVTALQYCMWAAGRGRAEAVPGGFANVGEWKACAVQLVPALLLMDMYYYWCHRFLHLRIPYKCVWHNGGRASTRNAASVRWAELLLLRRYIHHMHHTVHVPYACAAFYLHPLEALMLDHGAAFCAATLFPGMRFWVVVFIQLLLPVRACHEHMGYVWPWDVDNSRLGTRKVTHHGIHHQPRGHKWNYATPFFTFTDDLFGTRYVEKKVA